MYTVHVKEKLTFCFAAFAHKVGTQLSNEETWTAFYGACTYAAAYPRKHLHKHMQPSQNPAQSLVLCTHAQMGGAPGVDSGRSLKGKREYTYMYVCFLFFVARLSLWYGQ